MSLLNLFEAARRVSVPIVVVRTLDQTATVEALKAASEEHPLLQWDAVRGLTPVRVKASGATKPTKDEQTRASLKVAQDETIGFPNALLAAADLPQGAIVFCHNAHLQVAGSEPAGRAQAIQAIANLREQFKANFRMLVLMGPSMPVPMELEQDVVVLDHALPDDAALRVIVKETYQSGKVPAPTEDVLKKAVEALGGLSSFAAEQVAAMSLRENGLDLQALWDRKRIAIEQTRGLHVWQGTERFADLIGLESIKTRLKGKLQARTPIGCVVFLDEIDKVLANVEGDTSGVRMDQLRTLLTEMENNEWRGICCVGVAGGGKSAIAKAFGNEAGVPTVQLDLGDMEGPHVGESEQMLRQAMSVIKAIGRGNAYIIATSNNASVMRPELQRRFTDGFFFFDVMSQEERRATWKFYITKYKLGSAQIAEMPDDNGWTGAEIRNCCRDAWDSRSTLMEASRFVVPMSTSRADSIDELRQYANGRFLDANKFGSYAYTVEPMEKQRRAIKLPPEIIDVLETVPPKHMN